MKKKFKYGDTVRSKTGKGRPSFKIVAENKHGYDISDGLSTEFGTFTPEEMEAKFTILKKKIVKKKKMNTRAGIGWGY